MKRLVMYRDEAGVRMEADGMAFCELATMCGVMQVLVGEMALKGGTDIETVKDSMLEIHLQAMRDMERQMQICRMRKEDDGGIQAADCKGKEGTGGDQEVAAGGRAHQAGQEAPEPEEIY